MKFRLPRLQFSLRTLVILVVIVAALASWHGSRYARYRARFLARVQAKEHGLVFYTREEAEGFQRYKFHTDAEPTWVERWDLFWFGREAGKFPVCEMSMRTYHYNPKPYAEKNYRAVLELHPEIELAVVSGDGGLITQSKVFQRVAWYIGGADTIPRLPGLMTAVNDFARLPKLRYFQYALPSVLDDSWVATLQETCVLQELHGEHELSPAAVLALLQKAPHLKKFVLLPQCMPDEVRISLQEKYTITEIQHPTRYLIELKK